MPVFLETKVDKAKKGMKSTLGVNYVFFPIISNSWCIETQTKAISEVLSFVLLLLSCKYTNNTIDGLIAEIIGQEAVFLTCAPLMCAALFPTRPFVHLNTQRKAGGS